MKTFFRGRLMYTLFSLATAVVGMEIHHNVFWAVVDFFFAPLVWLKWLIYHEVSMSIIVKAFKFFFK